MTCLVGDQMNEWEREFARRMELVREQSTTSLEQYLKDDVQAAFDAVSNFLSQWRFQVSTPQSQAGRRCFKFALTEDAYVLVMFRLEGIDSLECECEYSLPLVGRVAGTRWSCSLRKIDRQWAETCFQKALDGLLGKLAEAETRRKGREPVLVR